MSDIDRSYLASATCSSLGTDEMMGQLRFGNSAVLFSSDNANVALPADHLEIERIEGGVWVLTDPNQSEWTLYCRDTTLFQDPTVRQWRAIHAQIRELDSQDRSKSILKHNGVFLGAFVALCLGLLFIGKIATALLIRNAPPEWDQKLGKLALEDADDLLSKTNQEGFAIYQKSFQEITNRLLNALGKTPHHYYFTILDESNPNAFAVPGGHIFINRGLLEFAKSSEEIAGVLAHEIAHIEHRHGLRQAASAAGTFAVTRVLASGERGFAAAFGTVSSTLLTQRFSRDHEAEADAIAFQLLQKSKIDPRSISLFLKHLSETSAEKLANKFNVKVLSSHPPTPERIRDLEELWKTTAVRSGWRPLPPWPKS